jgi:DNA adenine methylase
MERPDHRYTVGCGKGKEVGEVLILSWDLAAEPAGLF